MDRIRGASFRTRNGKTLVSVQSAPGSSKRTERSFDTRAKAEAWAAAALAAVNAGQPVPDADLFRNGVAAAAPILSQAGGPDFATVCWRWHREYYDLQRRAQPERAMSVADDLRLHVVPFFATRTTSIADLDTTTPEATELVVDFLHHLAGTRPDAGQQASVPLVPIGNADFTTAAELCDVSISTIKRARAKGQLPNARKEGPAGRLMIPVSDLMAARLLEGSSSRKGLARSTAKDVLGTLRRVLGYARRHGWIHGDPTEGLRPFEPAGRSRGAAVPARPVTLVECRAVAAHLHLTHQLAFWMQRLLGTRIGETFGVRVGDVVDLGEMGFVTIGRQGGRSFTTHDADNNIVITPSKEEGKTSAANRVLPVPGALMDLIRLVIRAFHTDPDTGAVDLDRRLVPGIRRQDLSGQATYGTALGIALKAEGLTWEALGFGVTSHTLRKSFATDLSGMELSEVVQRRLLGHRAGTDVHAVVYVLDDPRLRGQRDAARLVEEEIREEIGSVLVPTAQRENFGTSNPLHLRTNHIESVLSEAFGIDDDPAPLLTAAQIAEELHVSVTAVRRWMKEGRLASEDAPHRYGGRERMSRLSAVRELQDELATEQPLLDVARDLDLSYHQAWALVRDLELVDDHHDGDPIRLGIEQVKALQYEVDRVARLHARAVKAAEVTKLLRCSRSTVHQRTRDGVLVIDEETDSSGAKFITRASVAALVESATSRTDDSDTAGMTPTDVAALAGLRPKQISDLVKAGHLTRGAGPRGAVIPWDSLMRWAIGFRPDLLVSIERREDRALADPLTQCPGSESSSQGVSETHDHEAGNR